MGAARHLALDGDLFASGPAAGECLQLVDDREGGVRCWPALVDAETADAWFAQLRHGMEWTRHRRRMYDREVDVPRLVASCRLADAPPGLPLAGICGRVRERAPAPYNAVGLNLYRDGRDSVAMHNDKLHTLVPGQPIAIVSLGDTRRMQLKSKAPGRARIDVELSHGSLLVMSHASQLTHDHGIPKTTRAIGPRMSVVFRVRPRR
jgi:alkylated DNA repair dioxygenase AlkB